MGEKSSDLVALVGNYSLWVHFYPPQNFQVNWRSLSAYTLKTRKYTQKLYRGQKTGWPDWDNFSLLGIVFLGQCFEMTEVAPKIWATFSHGILYLYHLICKNLDKKCVVLHFGQFIHKLIWSLWPGRKIYSLSLQMISFSIFWSWDFHGLKIRWFDAKCTFCFFCTFVGLLA
jgi:hypothetical protein